MKTANFPAVRVEPELRAAAEGVLREGESLSGFVEQSIRENIERRKTQHEFIARGLAARDASRRSGNYISAEQVIERLQAKLAKARGDAPLRKKSVSRGKA